MVCTRCIQYQVSNFNFQIQLLLIAAFFTRAWYEKLCFIQLLTLNWWKLVFYYWNVRLKNVANQLSPSARIFPFSAEFQIASFIFQLQLFLVVAIFYKSMIWKTVINPFIKFKLVKKMILLPKCAFEKRRIYLVPFSTEFQAASFVFHIQLFLFVAFFYKSMI